MDLAFLDQLNETQRDAVVNVEGPQIIVAGAGSGKTRVLTYRLAFILSQGLADPQELLALTFTNKAAKEMKARIEKLIGTAAKSIHMGTFHSIFAKLLRGDAERIGYTRNFTIYDDDDSLALITTIIKELKIDDKAIKPRNVLHFIGSAKNKLLSPVQAKEFIADEFSQHACRVYEIYQVRCQKANAMDFGDLLMKPIELFQTSPSSLEKYQDRFKYILIDEYQDTNHAQYLLTKMLAAKHENICVVGDDAQSIYAFRGANIQNILNFYKDYPKYQIYKLEQNYRSTQNIVGAASSVIKNNKDQIPKEIFTKNDIGELIQVIESDTEQDEAKRVSDKIREYKQIHNLFNYNFAILYRTNAQSRAMEDALRRVGIKYRIFGGLSFYKRKEIRDVVAYLRIAINPMDEQAMVRIINYPTRGISDNTVTQVLGFAAAHTISFWDALQRANEIGLNARAVNSIHAFIGMVHRFQKIAQTTTAAEAVETIAKESGVLKELHSEGTPEAIARWENVQELMNSAKEYVASINEEANKLDAYLAEISLFTEIDENEKDPDFVTLMTIHSSKGLEFHTVFLVGLEEGLFPGFSSLESRQDLEEERRLFYVAVTRAERNLFITYARTRYRYGQIQYNDPSRFLQEIDSRYLKYNRLTTGKSVAPTSPSFRTAPTSIGASPSHIPPTAIPFIPDDPEKMLAGLSVIHQKFGKGKILAVEGAGDHRKANVLFLQGGERVLLLKYAKLQIVAD